MQRNSNPRTSQNENYLNLKFHCRGTLLCEACGSWLKPHFAYIKNHCCECLSLDALTSGSACFIHQTTKDATSVLGPLKTTKHVAFALDAITYKTFDNSGELPTPIFHENCSIDEFEQDSNVDVSSRHEFSPPPGKFKYKPQELTFEYLPYDEQLSDPTFGMKFKHDLNWLPKGVISAVGRDVPSDELVYQLCSKGGEVSFYGDSVIENVSALFPSYDTDSEDSVSDEEESFQCVWLLGCRSNKNPKLT